MKASVPVFTLIIIFFVNMTATAQISATDSLILKRLDNLLKIHETDPQISVTNINSVPRWNGSTLVNGTITDNGYAVGIHTPFPQAALHVTGDDETAILEEAAANSLGTGTILLLKGRTANQSSSEGRIGLVPEDGFYPYRSGAIEIRPQSRTNFYKSFNVTDPSNLAMTIVSTGVGIGTASPDASAVLDISSASQGVLIPRMSGQQRRGISNPANGLIVYQTGAGSGIYFYDDTAWRKAGSPNYKIGSGLALTGDDSLINTAPDVPVTLTGSGNTTVTGTYPNFTISSAGGSGAAYTAGSGISIANNVITNTAPDQKVTIETGGTIAMGGTYPNFYLTSPEVTIAAGPGINVQGQFPHFTISSTVKMPSLQSGATDDEINDLKQQVARQQAEIDELKGMMASLSSSAGDLQSNRMAMSLSGASLGQNVSNPFRGTAVISYTLPATYSFAKLVINDNYGKTIKEITLSGKGNGSAIIDASALAAGSYRYSLMVDGKLMDTKQMMVVK